MKIIGSILVFFNLFIGSDLWSVKIDRRMWRSISNGQKHHFLIFSDAQKASKRVRV